ncbi:MAG: hypothetical protein EPN47_03650 [Acidobacteria bacterium]|nr:MAG: hypothetical protein EPN47_03650 [Acidobacteriota bacterium]
MVKKLTLILVVATFGIIFLPLRAQAQRGSLTGTGQFMRWRPHGPIGGTRQGPVLTGRSDHRHFPQYWPGAYPYLYPPYYDSGYYSEPVDTGPQQERVVVIENTQPRAEVPPSPPPQSLMLELRGNHWVRVTDSGQTVADLRPGEKGPEKAANVRTIAPQASAANELPRELPPAVLVFRDGHKEKVSRYTIVGGNIYASNDYWNNGSWTKKVPIAELDVPTTLELNRELGTNFSLPSGPHVVVIRP